MDAWNDGEAAVKVSRHIRGATPRSVAIVACGPTSQAWHSGNFTYERQFGTPDEVWALNKGLRTIRADLGWVMDDLVGEARRSDQYARDLAQLIIPVMTSTVDAEVRRTFPDLDLFAYPLAAVLTHLGHRSLCAAGRKVTTPAEALARGQAVGMYLHNSIPYLLAYALYIGVEHVALFGCDYTFPGQDLREDDRANAEYWVGLLRGLGVRVEVPDTTTLLNVRQKRTLYGYGARPPRLVPLDDEAFRAAIAGS